MPTVIACRLWLAGLLVQLAAWLHPSDHVRPALVVHRPLTPLQLAARQEVGRLQTEPFSTVSKRQIVFRTLRDQFPGAGVSTLNYALEEAVRDLAAAAGAAGPDPEQETVIHG